jgi:hypothetical protein
MEPSGDIYLSLCDSGWADVDVDKLKSKLDERIILKRFSEMDKISQDLNFSFPGYKNKESKFQGDEVRLCTLHEYFSEYLPRYKGFSLFRFQRRDDIRVKIRLRRTAENLKILSQEFI